MKRPRTTAGDLVRDLQSDPRYQALRRDQDATVREVDAFLHRAQEPLRQDLARVGIAVQSVWDLVNSSHPYPEAVETLLDHLGRPYHPRIREGIARALAVPQAAGEAWDVLCQEFCKEHDPPEKSVKWALGMALSVVATKQHVDQLIALLRDRSHGESRACFVEPVLRLGGGKAKSVLTDLVSDPDIGKDVRQSLQRLDRSRRKTQ